MPAGTLKRLVLCLDGTWNRADGEDPLTNVVRLRDLIDPRVTETKSGTAEDQRIYYDEGVGTGFLERIRGGAFGIGLSQNVRQAYRFLSRHYGPGMEVYVFGFSRGAFTARSLVGYIGAAGLLLPDQCTPELEARCWANYRTPPKDRYPSERAALAKYMHPDFRVTCLGVFDTVGALGVPLEWFGGWNRKKYAFHDTTLSSIVDHALHALAIDEKRGPFQAAIWERPQHEDNKSIEQVWFPGVHSNIGGGYQDESLSDLTLRWMIDRISAKGLALKFDAGWDEITGNPCGMLHESRTVIYRYSKFKPMVRVISQLRPKEKSNYRLCGLPLHARPIGEMLHWSVLKRWTEGEEKGIGISAYAPPNAMLAIPAIYQEDVARRLPVVGPSGEKLDWMNNQNDYDFLKSIMPAGHRTALDRARNGQPIVVPGPTIAGARTRIESGSPTQIRTALSVSTVEPTPEDAAITRK